MRYLLLLISILVLVGLIFFGLKLIPLSFISHTASNSAISPTINSPSTTLHPQVTQSFIPQTQSQSLEYQDRIFEYQNQVIDQLQP